VLVGRVERRRSQEIIPRGIARRLQERLSKAGIGISGLDSGFSLLSQ